MEFFSFRLIGVFCRPVLRTGAKGEDPSETRNPRFAKQEFYGLD